MRRRQDTPQLVASYQLRNQAMIIKKGAAGQVTLLEAARCAGAGKRCAGETPTSD